MKHAGERTLEELAPFIADLRALPGLVEKRPGAFSRGSRALLHFHEDPTGPYADVRFGDKFERVRIATHNERQELLERINAL